MIQTSCESEVDKLSTEKYEISQGYLIATRGITVRVRKSSLIKKSVKNDYYFTLKVNSGGRVIEIEKSIDQRDFQDLWDITLNKLDKIRYILKHAKTNWEVDFFKDYKNETYMAVAEIELPEGQTEPDSIPEIIKKNLIHKVGLTDTRFSNKLLADSKYAVQLLKNIIKESQK